jgi:hypothetical protein
MKAKTTRQQLAEARRTLESIKAERAELNRHLDLHANLITKPDWLRERAADFYKRLEAAERLVWKLEAAL